MAALDIVYVPPAAEIAATLTRLSQDLTANTLVHQGQTMPPSDDLEPQLATTKTHVSEMEDRFGAASSLTCPDCGGALCEIQEGSAVRVLEEHVELKTRMARRAAKKGLEAVSQGFAQGPGTPTCRRSESAHCCSR